MDDIKQIFAFFLILILSVAIGSRFADWLGKKFHNAINSVIPDYTPVVGKRVSDDPYINSVLNDVKGREEITKLKKTISKFISTIFTVLLAFALLSLYLSDRKDPPADSSLEVVSVVGSKSNKGENKEGKSEENIKKPIQFGPFGDLFNGMLAPILTFATFTGLLVTIIMQNIQMRATITELQMSRIEMSESTDALQAQVKNSTAQKFDSNFYEMLRFHLEVMKDYLSNSLAVKEYESINKRGKEWENFLYPDEIRGLSLINYQLLKFIRDNEKDGTLDKRKAKNYANIVRATISEDVFGLFFVNVLQNKFDRSKELMEYYEFFEHLAFSKFKNPYVMKRISLYKKEAFGDELNLKNFYINKKSDLLSFSLMEIKENYDKFIIISKNATKSIFKKYYYLNEYPEMEINELKDEFDSYVNIVNNLKIEDMINNCILFEMVVNSEADNFLIKFGITKEKFYKKLYETLKLLKTYIKVDDANYQQNFNNYKELESNLSKYK